MPPRSRGNEKAEQQSCSNDILTVMSTNKHQKRKRKNFGINFFKHTYTNNNATLRYGKTTRLHIRKLFFMPISKHLILLLHWSAFLCGECCMPGYEEERSRLRHYLGIEWIPKGLGKMDAKKTRFIQHSDELNCDFSKPENCMWLNVRPAHGNLDTLDFHLFRKEDNTEFPVLHIRPGPSKLPIGDQMLLVGDKRRQEQSAILASHPIKCQNTTGKLTLTFWLYNGARLEVLILNDSEEGHLMQLPEKPQIDCGTVQMNTECIVLIPPRDQPFRIGIRAYDVRNPEGSFVMLDNLLYEAQFCRVSIDFGNGFYSEPLITGANGLLVKTVDMLDCHDFDANCHWRNLGRAEHGIWKRAMGESPPSAMLFNKTGTYMQPTLPAAFFYIEEGNRGILSQTELRQNDFYDASTTDINYRIFASDPIQCLNSSVITLQFSIWSTKGIELSCCLLEPQTMRVLHNGCQSISTEGSPAPVQHHFHLPNSVTQFMFAIRVDNVNPDFDNFVILDDFELIGPGAERCGTHNIPNIHNDLLLDGLYTTPILSVLLNRPVQSAKDLFCDFSKRALNCQWANLDRLTEGMNPWEIAVFDATHKQEQHKVSAIQLQDNFLLPDGNVAFARLDTINDTAVLISEIIQCVYGGGILSFRNWRSGSIELGICVVRANTLEVLDCQNLQATTSDEQREALRQQQSYRNENLASSNIDGEQVNVDIPLLDEPIRLAFRAVSRGQYGGRVAIDDIQFEGNICATKNVAFASKSGHNKGHQQQQSDFSANGLSTYHQQFSEYSNFNGWHAVPDENVCRLLSCDFQRESNMCLYSSSRIASSVSMFRAYNRTAFVMLFTRSRVAMLESPIFHLNAPARLHFDFAISKGKANLNVCQDSVMRELANCIAIFTAGQTNGWEHDYVDILTTDRKLYLVTKLHDPTGKASIQLDNFVLTDVGNHRIC